MRRGVFPAGLLLVPAILVSILLATPGQAAGRPRPLITQRVDTAKLATLGGNTRPEAIAKYDRGLAPANLAMDHMFLLLKRSPEQEQELRALIDDLTDSSSPNFHQWLTAKEFGERFGVAQQDRDTIKSWLESYGLKVNIDYANGVLIDFSGTASQVSAAFHTAIHELDVKGVTHFANMSDPQIPEALTPAINGVVSLHDFKPHTMYKRHASYTVGDGTYLVVPGDLATIYNLNPLFSVGISGQGQTIVVVEDTNVYTTADWTSFRSVFGLSAFTDGSFTQVHPAPPSGSNNCGNPGTNSDDTEAILDAEYASAAAPSAAIVLASCKNTATFGGLIALQNLLNASGAPPPIVSMSYGECEALNGATANAAFNSTFQQAVSEGVSVFVSSGDDEAAGCDRNAVNAIHGIGITGWGSSPYNVSVGGTDYGDTFAGTNSTYWSATNSPTFASARSYIPEIPWNDSCASVLLTEFKGFSVPYGSDGFCNSSAAARFLQVIGGSGGPSGCATGSPAQSGIVGGSCAGWDKPSYQSVFGNPSDGVRDIPDVSLFAADGVWKHYYPFCFSGPDGTPCTNPPSDWPGGGGTSFSSPIMAGIQALVNQKAGGAQGNPNPIYYQLARGEYGNSGNSACNSTLGKNVDSSCIFYDVTQGDMDANCNGSHNCYVPSGLHGVLSTSNSSYQPAYTTTTGWDFATGIGTVNAANLVNNWPVSMASFTLSASPNSVSIVQGNNGASTITITPQNGFNGNVTLSTSGLPSGVTSAFSPNPASTTSLLTLTAGANAHTGTSTMTIKGVSGSITQTTMLSLTVTPSVTGPAVTVSPASLAWGNVIVGATGPKKAVTLTNVGTTTLNISGITTGGDFSQTTSPKPCGSTLTAGQNCKIEVTFTPTQVGARSGTLTITDNAPNSPQTIPLSGTGSVRATLTPVSATFASEKVGVPSPAKVFTLMNKQSVNLTGIAISTTGDFSISTTTCTMTLAAKAKCTVSVVFTPTATGTRTGTLSVADNAMGSPQTSSLKGTGK